MVRLYTEELVYTETEDGIILAGLVIWPDGRPAKPIAVVWVPGFSINFYHPSFVAIGRELAGLGYAFVIGNNRGHDIGAHLWRKKEDADGMTRTYGGAFWERFEDSPRDVAAWIGFALSLGFQGVGLVGHSFGAKKVVYYQARRQDPRVSGLVVASTPIAAPALDPELVALSEQMMAGGRGMELLPWGSFMTFFVGTLSAQTYLSRVPDLFGVSSAHAEIGKIRCPLLVCCGTNESDDPALSLETIQAHETIRHKAAASPKVDVAMFEGANHGYDNHEGEVAEALAHWIDTLPQLPIEWNVFRRLAQPDKPLMGVMGTRGKHVNVLQHLMGFLQNHLSSEDRAYLRQVGASGPHRGLPTGAGAPDRAADVASHRLKHHLNRHPVPEWLHQQVYLHPYPKESMLWNHVQFF